jgi:glycosyltransferase involved in cell wall biosynthesis
MVGLVRPYNPGVKRPLSILHLIDKNRLTTGSVVQALAAAAELSRRGHTAWVGGPAGGELEPACADAALPYFTLPFRSPLDLSSASTLRRQLRRHETDILHVHKGRAHAVALIATAGMGRRPRLVVNRGVAFPLDLFNKWKYRHPRVAATVCVADAVRESVIRSAGVDPERVHTVYGGTDTDIFDPARIDGEDLRRELGIDREHLLIGHVSLRNWKGWADLMPAFAGITDRFPNARLLFVGCETEEERSKVDRTAQAVGVAGRVLTTPYRSDMPKVLVACDVVVDPSWAGTGITGTIREAMAMGRAVVATDCGGNRELVIDGEVGLLVPPRDIGAMARALTRLLEDPDLRQRLGIAARKRVIGHFTTEHRIDRLETLYRALLS